jgi:integrase
VAHINEIIENENYLGEYIRGYCTTRSKNQSLSSFLIFLDRLSNKTTNINYKRSKSIFIQIKQKRDEFDSTVNQTEIIPSRILAESIRQRWIQIDEIENNLNNIVNFLEEYLSTDKYCEIISITKKKQKKFNDKIEWINFINKHNLEKLFKKYNVANRLSFKKFIIDIQGTSKHIILAYTGMRNGEALNLKIDCLDKKELSDGICRLITSTSKLSGRKQESKWVTTKKIEKVIHILKSIAVVISSFYKTNIKDIPLFITTELLLDKQYARTLKTRKNFLYFNELKLDYNDLKITDSDKKEIQEIEFNRNYKDIEIGKAWRFRSHQYRRSLAVYSIQSGIVSLGALQIQLKHQFREMTLYYSNGASYAKKLFNIPRDHIANDFDQIKPELETLAYIKEVLFSEDKLYGGHGKFVENNLKQKEQSDFNEYFFENRNKILKQFKNGEIAYKRTALGGCISTEPCDSKLTCSIIACFDCHGSILEKSRVNNVILKQKEFISFLDANSIEYRTELEELNKLEDLKNKLIKE